MNINEFVKNNCCIKNTEMIFTLYIPSWDIHNIKVKFFPNNLNIQHCHIRSSVTLFCHIPLIEQFHSLNMASSSSCSDLFGAFC